MPHRPLVREGDDECVPDFSAQDRPGNRPVEGPYALFAARRHLLVDLDGFERDAMRRLGARRRDRRVSRGE